MHSEIPFSCAGFVLEEDLKTPLDNIRFMRDEIFYILSSVISSLRLKLLNICQEDHTNAVQKQAALLQHKLLQNLRQAIIEKPVANSVEFTIDALDELTPSGSIAEKTEKACRFFLDTFRQNSSFKEVYHITHEPPSSNVIQVEFNALKEMESLILNLKVPHGAVELCYCTKVFITKKDFNCAHALILPRDIKRMYPSMHLQHPNTLVYTIVMNKDFLITDIKPC